MPTLWGKLIWEHSNFFYYMKKTIILLFLLLRVILPANATGITYVLAVGVSRYESSANDLHQTAKDAKAFRKLMLTQTENVSLITSRYATCSAIRENLKRISRLAQSGDRIVFFFSGHGSPNAICAHDGELEYVELQRILSNSKASEKLCFIDACFAGSVKSSHENDNTDWISKAPHYEDQVWFVSCSSRETSSENRFIGAGMFTQALLKALYGKSDKDKNKEITVSEAFAYVYNDVVRRSNEKQHPQLVASNKMRQLVIMKWY